VALVEAVGLTLVLCSFLSFLSSPRESAPAQLTELFSHPTSVHYSCNLATSPTLSSSPPSIVLPLAGNMELPALHSHATQIMCARA
jgi:hypothetical protein